jgi:predicted pyridoxine 5'-phosphate oxidase superfamily flavin-nucleotide-binding protein
MIPETLQEIMRGEGIAAIATQGKDGPHLVNTWHSYITVNDEGHFLIPAAWYRKTEENLKSDPRVLMTMGSRNVQGLQYVGTGYLITGTAEIAYSGPDVDLMKQRFDWLRAVLIIKPETFEQTL